MRFFENVDLGTYVRCAADADELVVQHRMGMANPRSMAAGLCATGIASAKTVGTITLDSYTRVDDHQGTRVALEVGGD